MIYIAVFAAAFAGALAGGFLGFWFGSEVAVQSINTAIRRILFQEE